MSDDILKQELEKINANKRANSVEANCQYLLKRILEHPQLSQSNPPFTYDYLLELSNEFTYNNVRDALNKIRIWIKAGNVRENYCATLFSWLQREKK